MKKNILLFSLIFLAFLASSQEEYRFFELESKADSLFGISQFSLASKYYDRAFNINVSEMYKVYSRYNAACSFAMTGKIKCAFKQLSIITDRDSKYRYTLRLNPNDFLEDTLFNKLYESRRWNKFIEQTKINYAELQNRLDSNLIKTIVLMGERDQEYRQQIKRYADDFGYDSQEMKELDRKIRYNDSLNFYLVDSIISSIGWPGKDLIGDESFSFFIIVQHMDLERQLKYLPLLKLSIKNGTSLTGYQMLLEDRINLEKDGHQLYGSQWCRDKMTGEFYICPIQNPSQLDERRFELGLIPFKNEMRQSGIIWNIDEYIQKLSDYEEIYERDRSH